MDRRNKVKYIFSLTIVIIGILSLLAGTSYAILKGSTTAENEQVIKAGSVELKLTENFENISKKVTIMSNVDGLLQEDTYDFNLRNIGSEPAEFKIKLENDVPSDYTGNVLGEEYFKIGLEINGEEYGPISLSDANNIIDSDIIYEREMINYKMRIWLDEKKAEELSNMEDYKAFLKLKVEATQRPEEIDSGKTTVFNYTGDVQEYKVTRDGWYYIELSGGSGYAPTENEDFAGGAKTSGYIELKAGEKLYFYVGGKAVSKKSSTFNGGGGAGYGSAGYTISSSISGDTGSYGYTGGGATDVRLVSGNWDDSKSLISRIMVAGAGGSASPTAIYNNTGGNSESEGLYGIKGAYYSGHGDNNCYGQGAKQQSGGAGGTNLSSYGTNSSGTFGKGGTSNSYSSGGGASGGGGGYYGGGAGGGTGGGGTGHGSGGGSSYISGFAGVNSVEESTTIKHTNQTLHYSGKYFIGSNIIGGTNYGNGYAKITYVNKKPKIKNENLKNVRYIKNCINGDSSNNLNSWIEIQAIKDGVNVAKGKTGSIYDASGNAVESLGANYAYTYVTDGIIDNVGGSIGYAAGSTRTGHQCFIVDLEEEYDLEEVAAWHYINDMRTYYDEITYVSSDNNNWIELINETMYGHSNGKRVNAYTHTYNGYTQDGLVLWLDAHANTGTVRNYTTTTWKDLSGTGNDGTISGATWNYKFLSFDGSNDSVSKTSASYGITDNQYTLEIVFTPEATTNQYQILFNTVNSGTTVQQYMNTWLTNQTRLGFDYTDGTNYNALQHYLNNDDIGKKVKTTNVLGNSIAKMYINSELTDKVSLSFTPKIYSSGLYISAPYYFKGKIYSIRVYNKALTEEAVKNNTECDKQRFNLE